jgi:hypothetical protein
MVWVEAFTVRTASVASSIGTRLATRPDSVRWNSTGSLSWETTTAPSPSRPPITR